MSAEESTGQTERLPQRNYWPEILAVILPVLWGLALFTPKFDLPSDQVFLGFVQSDQPYYYACAREVFENGNILFYGSPYSNLPDSPRIYSHLVFSLFGLLWRAGISFTAMDQGLRVILGIVMLWLVTALFRAALPRRSAGIAAGIAISCGGLAWFFAFWRLTADYCFNLFDPGFHESFVNRLTSYPERVAEVEGGYADWHQDLLRNLTFTPEVFYHVLFFACILSVLKRKPRAAGLFLFLAWWAHPFTGAELGLILAVYALIEWLVFRKCGARFFAAVVSINLIFLAYYALFLPRFAEHLSIDRQNREFGNPMLISMLLPAYGLFLPAGIGYLFTRDFRARFAADAAVRLFVYWLGCVAFLVFHDRLLFFMRPWQPMHFTRGYFFVPLAFFAAGFVQSRMERFSGGKRFYGLIGVALLALAHIPDNVFYLRALRARALDPLSAYSMRKECRGLLLELDRIPETLTVHSSAYLPDCHRFEFWVPVLTHHRSVLGHYLNTPNMTEKAGLARQLALEPARDLLSKLRIGVWIANPRQYEALKGILHPAEFRLLFRRGELYVVRLEIEDGGEQRE